MDRNVGRRNAYEKKLIISIIVIVILVGVLTACANTVRSKIELY